MKEKILVAAFALAAIAAHAQLPLTIIEQDYELAKHTALKHHKLLIVDFYTTWCVPCKLLDTKIFKNDSIAREIGKHFLVLKYDAEHDTKHNLALKHHVCSYPTTIILNDEGRLINKMFGLGENADSLLENYRKLLREGMQLNNEGKYIAGVSNTIDTTGYPSFYKRYVRRIADIKPGDLSSYWTKNQDFKSEVSFDILAYFGDAPKQVNDFFLKNKTEYEHRFGKTDVRFVLGNMASGNFSKAVAKKDERSYNSAIAFAKQQLPLKDADALLKAYQLEMQIVLNKWGKAADIVAARIRLGTIREDGINNFCWSVYKHCNEKKTLDKAVQWMKDVVHINPSFAALDTYARLLAKNGDTKSARISMHQAIQKGKADGEDTKESEEALSKF